MSRVHTSESICTVCNSADVVAVVEIQQVPIHCNNLWPSREAALAAPKGDIRLGFCGECGHTFNLVFNPDRMQYTPGYENSLHFSSRFQDYASSLIEQLMNRYNLRGKNIIEIGCGKGEFLALLCEGGRNHGVGFDPGYDGERDSGGATESVTFIRDFFSEAYAAYPADFICCRQVLEHIQYPRTFLSQLRRAIGNRWATVVFFEVPNVLYTLRDLGIWDIIYEHCSYFSPASLARVFTNAGFRVLQVYETFGEQFLCLEASPVVPVPHRSMAVAERLDQLPNLARAFGEAYRNKVRTWNGNLRRLFDNGRRIVVWGAGSKGVTFLNTVKGGDQIRYVVDINSRKQGKYVAGTGQQIVAPAFLREYQADTVLVMNPLYKDEIQEALTQLHLEAEILVL